MKCMICHTYIYNNGSYLQCLLCNSFICKKCIKLHDDKLFYFDKESSLYRLRCNICYYHTTIMVHI